MHHINQCICLPIVNKLLYENFSDFLEDLTPESYVIMTFLDFMTVFNIVDHNILIRTLKTEYGVGRVALNWFKSYLSIRSYKGKINDTLSDVKSLAFGLPQGKTLGPMSYIYYMLKTSKNSRE